MTEVDVDSANPENSGDTGGAGRLLREAREQQQLSLQGLAATLKVPAYKLQALEDDRWDELADSVFTRSLALSVCRLLRIPAEPVLAGLPKHEAAKLAANPEGINMPFKEKTLRSLMSSSQESSSGTGVKLAAALLIAIALGAGLYFLPQWDGSNQGVESSAAVVEGVPEDPLFMPASQSESALVEPVPEVAVAAAVVEPVAEAVAAAVAVAPVAETVTPAAVVPVMEAALPEVIQPVAATNGLVLRFAATGESWVQVRDSQDRVVMDKILQAGDVYQETVDSRPLQVVLGNASATTLEVNGAALDVQASARNNVARLEVK